jgi:uncharacterized protein YecT (DUF1311 family)
MAFSLILSALLAAQPLNCTDPESQAEMNMCARADFERADADLNTAYQAAIEEARRVDAGIDRSWDTRSGHEEELRAAQRAWVAFRDSWCTYVGYQEARGGSMEPLSFNACRALVTRERARQLRNAVSVE